MHDRTHADSSLRAASLDSVEGFNSASPRTSLTNAKGVLRLDPIDGVQYRLARPVSHHHGHLTEAFRMDWGLADVPVVQVNVTVTLSDWMMVIVPGAEHDVICPEHVRMVMVL